MTHAEAIILAAGRSQRLGFAKALTQWHGLPILEIVLRRVLDVMARPIVVLANRAVPFTLTDEMARQLCPTLQRATIVTADPTAHPFDSLRAGLSVAAGAGPLLVWPVDTPFCPPDTLAELLASAQRSPESIAVPTVDGRRGHPVVFGHAARTTLLTDHPKRGLRSILQQQAHRLYLVPCPDARICRDIDTPQDLAELDLRTPPKTSRGIG